MKSKEEKKYYPVECSGYWFIQSGPNYEDPDILDAEKVGEERAEKNARLIADLLNAHYAQQSQPSGMSAEEVKEIAENHFKNTTWLEGTQEQDTKFGFRIGYMKAMKDFAIQNPSTASPAGAAEGASEGISKIREVMNWISQCVDEDHDLEVSEIKMIWNDLSDAISLIESTPHSSEGMAEALRKDIFRLDELRRFHIEPYNLGEMGEVSKIISRLSKLASLSPGVEDNQTKKQ